MSQVIKALEKAKVERSFLLLDVDIERKAFENNEETSHLRKALEKARVEGRMPLLGDGATTRHDGQSGDGDVLKGITPSSKDAQRGTVFDFKQAHRLDDQPGGGDIPKGVTPSAKDVQRSNVFDYKQTRVIEVPEKTFLKNRLVAAQEDCPANEYFKLIRTQLFQQTRLNKLNTIQIAGFGPSDGASFLALNLAISIAKDARQTTLLADFNFRTPTIGHLLGLDDELGLRSHFYDDVPLQDIFISPGIKKLTLLLAGGKIANPTELLGSPKMENLVRELKQRYEDRYIIFDTPPITDCPDSMVVSEYVDGIILVVRAHHTSRNSVKSAIDHFPKDKVLGVVLNDMPLEELAI